MASYTCTPGEIDIEKKLVIAEKERDEFAARAAAAEKKCALFEQLEDSFGRFLLKSKPELLNSESLSYKKGELGDEILGLCAVLRTNMTTVTSLGIPSQILDLPKMQLISDMLQKNTTLTNLNLTSNKIGDVEATTLREAIAVNKTLKTLSCGDNKVGDVGAKAIAEGLKKNTSITNLTFWTNNIGDEGVQAIAEAVRGNTGMQVLHLWGGAGDAGTLALCSALETIKLNYLAYHASKTTIVGFQALCAMIRNNTSMTRLCLSGIPIKGEEIKMLCDALQANTTLLTLDLEGHGLEEPEKKIICDAVRAKKGFQLAFCWKSGWQYEKL